MGFWSKFRDSSGVSNSHSLVCWLYCTDKTAVWRFVLMSTWCCSCRWCFLTILQSCGFPHEKDGGSESTVYYVAPFKTRFVAVVRKEICSSRISPHLLWLCGINKFGWATNQAFATSKFNHIQRKKAFTCLFVLFGQWSKHSLGILSF